MRRRRHCLQSGNLIFLPTFVVDPGPQTRSVIANLNATAIDEDHAQLVLRVGPLCFASVVCEVLDLGIALGDQFVASFLDDASQIA